MRIGIIGGGPAGLCFALLMKKHNSAHQIEVMEQNPADATYGWGVVFSERALSFLKSSDALSYADIEAASKTWHDQTIVHQGEQVRIDGSAYSGIGRLALLRILQKHCRYHGVELHFETRITDVSSCGDYDLLVGADGVNSVVRQQYAEHFQPSTHLLSNTYVWYGTHQRFETLSLIFGSYRGGAFVAHCYPYSDTTSTFIVECDAETWRRAGGALGVYRNCWGMEAWPGSDSICAGITNCSTTRLRTRAKRPDEESRPFQLRSRSGSTNAKDFREGIHIAGNREDFVKIAEAQVRLPSIIRGGVCFPLFKSRGIELASRDKQEGRVMYTLLERGDM